MIKQQFKATTLAMLKHEISGFLHELAGAHREAARKRVPQDALASEHFAAARACKLAAEAIEVAKLASPVATDDATYLRTLAEHVPEDEHTERLCRIAARLDAYGK